jgi:hypothetical protein
MKRNPRNPVCNQLEFGIKLLGARRADTVTELCFRIIPNIYFHLMPGSVIITDIFAVRAYGEQTFQRLNTIKRPLQLFRGFLKPGNISNDYPNRHN